MKIGVSQIAWSAANEDAALDTCSRFGITGIEVAPTKVWPNWIGIDSGSVRHYRKKLAEHGFLVPSIQAILFGQPDCQLFGTEEQRSKFHNHLLFCGELAINLGASRLVFGAPKNRDRHGLSANDAFGIAVDTLGEISRRFEMLGCCLCLEANPKEYGCNFLTASFEALKVVQAVGGTGVRLHLDSACMLLAGEDPTECIASSKEYLAHVHISEPNLGNFVQPVCDHQGMSRALQNIAYNQWACLEMRSDIDELEALTRCIQYSLSVYGV